MIYSYLYDWQMMTSRIMQHSISADCSLLRIEREVIGLWIEARKEPLTGVGVIGEGYILVLFMLLFLTMF